MKVLVTGAGGFIGRTLVPFLLERGYEVVALVRAPEGITFDRSGLVWRVADVCDRAALEVAAQGVDHIVHLAALKSDEPGSRAVNVGGAENVISTARAQGMRGIVNVSTMSTKLLRQGVYAKTKSDADALFAKSSVPTITLRLSVVYGDPAHGVVGSLIRYARLPLAPVIGSGRIMYRPIHVLDVAAAIEKVLSGNWSAPASYDLGGPDLVSLAALTRLVGQGVLKKRVRLFPIPLAFAYALALLFKLLLRKPPLTLSNVLGANVDVPIDTSTFNARYDLRPRTLAEGLALLKAEMKRESREPYVLMRYVLGGRHPSGEHVARYEQASDLYGLAGVPLDSALLRSPWRLKAEDAATRFRDPNGTLRRKLLIAAAIAECSPQSAGYLLPRQISLPSLLIRLCRIGFSSLAALSYGLLRARPSRHAAL
ncbi:NAD-dependent epimerase/dehydratase family protein [Candidatus Kaiserbacteria bacterium]|nr:NAD-dependent epimerase/dehydratase family protein [Candidatus Kaiserbacteria bacterium]